MKGGEEMRIKKNCSVTYYDNMNPRYDVMPNPYRDDNNDIWEGRKPHHIENGRKEYITWCGSATLNKNNEVIMADFNLSRKVQVWIFGNMLRIHDIRYDGDTRMWGYAIRDGKHVDTWPASDKLEDARIDSMLRMKNINNPIWKIVCRRAREMWLDEISKRDRLYRYEPEYND